MALILGSREVRTCEYFQIGTPAANWKIEVQRSRDGCGHSPHPVVLNPENEKGAYGPRTNIVTLAEAHGLRNGLLCIQG